MFKPRYTLTTNILRDLTAIAEAKGFIDRAKILPQQELRLRRQATIRMTHHSTEIEGNQLNLDQVAALVANKNVDAPDRDIYEVKNYLQALKYIEKVVATKKPTTKNAILKIHRLVTNKTLPGRFSGHYRTGHIYVVRRRIGRASEILYTGPDAKRVPGLVTDFIRWLEKAETQELNPVITAAVAHMEVAAIHPFHDGNGRTARALATLVLYQRRYDFRRLFALEDYYNTNRPAYYKAIDLGATYNGRQTDLTSWLEYFVKGFREEIDGVKSRILRLPLHAAKRSGVSQIYLTPQQLKIMDFLDQVGRMSAKDAGDVLSCPRRSAQLQLQKLKKIKMIKSAGKGKNTFYIANG